MITVRRDSEIHEVEGGWFHARWHFSFDTYRDPENDGFGAMRVFNDDRLIPGAVWPLHPHRDVEGLTYVVEGTFGHEDNVGGPFGPLPAGSVQRMTLDGGALHSELNASATEPMRFIQIWILPDTPSLRPGVEQRVFSTEDRTDRLLKVIGPERGEVVSIHQDASVHVAQLTADAETSHAIGSGRGTYLYLIGGAATVGGHELAHRRCRQGDRSARAAHRGHRSVGAHPGRRPDDLRAGRHLGHAPLIEPGLPTFPASSPRARLSPSIPAPPARGTDDAARHQHRQSLRQKLLVAG